MKISIKLSPKSIDEAIKRLEAYKREIARKAVLLVGKLAEYGAETARMEAADIKMTGELLNGIKAEYGGNIGYVKSTSKHSVYCEFGTGIQGKNNPHPDIAILGWKYDINNHGTLGWWYPTTADDKNTTKKELPDGTYIAWTKGMPSRPFMYNTAQKLRQYILPAAREVMQND